MIAGLGVCALLFTQLLVAAYACAMPAATNAEVSMVADGKPCHSLDTENPNLCQQHCQRASQSVDTAAQPAVDAPVLPLLAVLYRLDTEVPVATVKRDLPLAGLADPPLAIRNCRFRL